MTLQRNALREIVGVVGERGVVTGADAEPLLRDELEQYRGQAALVVRPASARDCARVVEICGKAAIGVVPQGGNTGYCGGATPFDGNGQILLSLSRMNRVRKVDPLDHDMTVEAGLVLSRAHTAAEEHGLMFPLSLGSQGSCQIGGVLSTNAGGVSVLRYGNARDLVLGLEVVLPNGKILTDLKGLRKDNAGYDLKALFLGAEGTLGVITAAVLKLFPLPRSRQTALLAVPSLAAACGLLRRAQRDSGERVVSAEYISRFALDLVLQHMEGTRDPLDEPRPHYLLLELAGGEPDSVLREILEAVLEAGVQAGEIVDGTVAETGRQRGDLWRLRESIPEAEGRAGGSIKYDIAVRTSRISEFLTEAERVLGAVGRYRLAAFGHMGDGNLHYNLLPPPGETLEAFTDRAAGQITEAVYELTAKLGGSFSAEHGIGILKRGELAKYASPAALALMRGLKTALDPNGIMNPGKVVG